MYLISSEGYKNAGVGFKRVRKTDEIWASMKNVGRGMGVKNISDLVLKEIHGILKAKNPTKEQIKEYKMTEGEIFQNFGGIKYKNNKNVYVKNVVMTAIIKRCTDEKKRGTRAIDGFRKELMIPDSEIPECPEFEVKSKIGKWFMNEKILKEYSVRVYEIDPFFMIITKKE